MPAQQTEFINVAEIEKRHHMWMLNVRVLRRMATAGQFATPADVRDGIALWNAASIARYFATPAARELFIARYNEVSKEMFD